ncbi:uncharacterized protein LOC144149701 [Haemaphysalis longicornis]
MSLNRAFGLPLAAFAFITIFLPVSIYRYSFVSNVHEHKLSSRPFQAMKYMDFGFLPSRPNMSTANKGVRLLNFPGANPSYAARQWFAKDRQAAPSPNPSVMARIFGLRGPFTQSSTTRASSDAGSPKPQTAETASPSMLRAVLQTKWFFEPRKRNSQPGPGDGHGEGQRDPRRVGGPPVPPLSRSQLWCVYRPPEEREREHYLLDDVPVSLCTAAVYCCLDVWRHGVRLYPDTDTARGAHRGLHARPRGLEYQEGDGGPNGIYHFHKLRGAAESAPKLRLYAMLGGRKQTTLNFVRKVASSSSSSDDKAEFSKDRSGAAGWSGDNVIGLLSRPINYTALDKLVDLSARWLQRMDLDGFVFNYRTDPHNPRADTVYLLHFREFHQRLAERGFEVALVLPDAVASARRSPSDAFGKERRRPSVPRLVATGYTPLVLPTHALVTQDRLLHGVEHGGYHDTAVAVLPPDGLPAPPPGEEQLPVIGLNGTSAATCPSPYSSDDPTLLTQEAMLKRRYGKLSMAMKMSTLVTVSFKADHYKLTNAKLYKELTPAYKVGESTYRDLCRIVNSTAPPSHDDSALFAGGDDDDEESRADSSTRNRHHVGASATGGARSYYGPLSGCLVVQSGHDWYSGFGPESARPLLLDGPGADFLGVVAFDMEADDFAGSCGGARHPLTRQLRRMLWLKEQRQPVDTVAAADAP